MESRATNGPVANLSSDGALPRLLERAQEEFFQREAGGLELGSPSTLLQGPLEQRLCVHVLHAQEHPVLQRAGLLQLDAQRLDALQRHPFHRQLHVGRLRSASSATLPSRTRRPPTSTATRSQSDSYVGDDVRAEEDGRATLSRSARIRSRICRRHRIRFEVGSSR